MDKKSTAMRVFAIRDARDWTQEDFARHAGVSVRTVSRWEREESEPRATTHRLLEALERGIVPGVPNMSLGQEAMMRGMVRGAVEGAAEETGVSVELLHEALEKFCHLMSTTNLSMADVAKLLEK